ncbi:MAG: O-antigen ligase family protein [Bradyrhizobium sp.]|nr:O-antigen ligase family protein [Bradyrhizobium sp.]
MTSGGLTLRRTAVISALIFLPAAIFAASLVRFTFIALAGTLCLATVMSEARQRKHVVIVACVILVAIAAGLSARYDQARQFADYATERSPGEIGLEKPPSCYLSVNLKNSIAIRKVLVQDAVFLIPRSGWIGTGLDSFMNFSCIKLTEVHNSVLQAAVEFGWIGGSLLLLLIVAAGGALVPLARYDDATRFVLCGLALVVLLSLAHGRVSRDGVLFALLGCAVGLMETSRAPARSAVVA